MEREGQAPPGAAPDAFRYYRTEDGNVFAVYVPTEQEAISRTGKPEGYAPVHPHSDSEVTWSAISESAMAACEAISADVAQRLHPALFRRMAEDVERP